MATSSLTDANGTYVGALAAILDITDRKQAEEAARESDEKIRLITETIEEVFWMSAPGVSGQPYISGAHEKIWGRPLEELRANPRAFMDSILPEDREGYQRVLDEKHTQGLAYSCEYRIRRPDGDVRWILEQGYPVPGENGQVSLMTGFCKDITERKRAEEELRRSEAALNAAQARARVGSWEYEVAADKPTWSREMFRIFDRDPSLGEPCWAEHRRSVHPDDWERIDCVIQDAIANGASYKEEVRLVRPDGSVLWVETNGETCRDESGKVTKLSGTVQDIDQRKRAEEALRKSEANLRAVLDNTDDLIAYRDVEGRLVAFNPPFAAIVRRLFRVEAQTGMRTMDYLPVDKKVHWEEILQDVLKGNGHREVFEYTFRDGEKRWYDISFNPIVVNGETKGTTEFTRDITGLIRSQEALADSQRLMTRAEEIAHLGYWDWDVAQESLKWSDELYHVFGVAKTFKLGFDEIVSLIHPEDRGKNQEFLDRLLSSGDPADVEFRIIRPDGAVRAVFQHAEVQRDAEGKARKAFGIIQDITERKRAEEQLRESEGRYRSIVETSKHWIWAIDQHGRHTYSNRSVEAILGYKPEEVLGLNTYELIHEEDRASVREEISRRIAGKRGWSNLVLRWRHKDGSYRYLESSAVPIIDEAGTLTGFRGSDYDITERRRMEEELRKSGTVLQEAERIAQVGGWEWDVRTNRCTLSRGWQQIHGLRKSELSLEQLIQVAHPDDRPLVKKAFQDAVDGVSPYNVEHRIIRQDTGEERVVRARREVVFDASGKALRMYGVSQDITERKKAEEELHRYQEKLRSMAALLAIAEQRERRKIAQYLHDEIAQSLIVTRMKIDSVRESGRPEEVQSTLEDVFSALTGVIKNTRNLTFELSPPVLHELGLAPAIEELAERMSKEHGTVIDHNALAQPKTLAGDVQVLLYQAVRELLMNVVKHSGATRAGITMGDYEGTLRVTVEDDGRGFDTEEKSLSHDDSGFGLFSLRERLQHIGGALEVESKPGEGTKVTVTVPARVLEPA